ncbi:MAG: hypothetical protein U0573_09995 [Phycisphaerales bacterium]|nr:hypothetical protein [Planctomycetota bacterium]
MKSNRIAFAASTLLLFVAPGVLAATDPAPAAAPQESLPDAKTLIEKHIEAIGGREKLKQVKSRSSSSTIEVPAAGVKGTTKVYQAPPAYMFTETEIGGIGKVAQGFDGEYAWETSVMTGPRLLSGKEADIYARSAKFNAEIDYLEDYKSLKTIGSDTVGGAAVYVVEMIDKNGISEKRLYDQQSGLLVGLRTKMPSQMGEIDSETTLSDYKEVGGIRVPYKVKVKVMGSEIITEVQNAEINGDVPPSCFEPPADVKSLIEKQKAKDSAPASAPATKDAPEGGK